MKKQSIIRKLTMIAAGLLIISCSNNDAARPVAYPGSKQQAAEGHSPAEKSYESAKAKTIANMLGAFEFETRSSARYEYFSQKAKAEGFAEIATLFQETSEAEKVHAGNHLAVLVNMGVNVHPVDTAMKVETTEKNLQAAIASEVYVVNKMYPLFINDALSTGNQPALTSLRDAYRLEEKHMRDYESALSTFNIN